VGKVQGYERGIFQLAYSGLGRAATSEKQKFPLTYRANQFLMGHLGSFQESAMSDQSSELVEISKLNGDFKKNYGKILGAFLYLRSVSAASGRRMFWTSLIATALAWLATRVLAWLHLTE
jgi:hypothetical protein